MPTEKRIAALVATLFLFQSAMDHHYYRFDYLLDLEEYPKSPLGWHYLRMKDIISCASRKVQRVDRKAWTSTHLLHLLSKNGKDVIIELRPYIMVAEANELTRSFEAIQIYLRVQQEEEKIFIGKKYDSSVFITGRAMWNMMKSVVNGTHELVYFKDKNKLVKILKGDPIYGTRRMLIDMKDLFADSIVNSVKDEIKPWN